MKTKKILVIDDEEAVRMATVMVLEHFGFSNIIQAASGEEGISMIQEHGADLVITDMKMPPGIGGEAVANWVKCDYQPAHPEIRILAVASDYDGSVEQAALSAGADAFLSKPYHIEELNKLVEDLLFQTIEV